MNRGITNQQYMCDGNASLLCVTLHAANVTLIYFTRNPLVGYYTYAL